MDELETGKNETSFLDSAIVNGHNLSDKPDNHSDKSVVSDSPASQSLFWPAQPEEETAWHLPPLPSSNRSQAQDEQMLDDLSSTITDRPLRAWLYKWRYRTRAAAASAEQSEVEKDAAELHVQIKTRSERELARLEQIIERLTGEGQSIESELQSARRDLAQSVAQAGIALPIHLMEGAGGTDKDSTNQNMPIHGIKLKHLEDSLEDSKPTIAELAGMHGMRAPGKGSFFTILLSYVMQIFAPLVAGMLLALCLGVLVGLFDIESLQRSDSYPMLMLAAALGFVIVYLMGEVYHHTVGMLGRNLERAEQQEGAPHPPRIRGGLGIAIAFAALAGTLAIAEITSEGLGLRILNQQQIARENRFQGGVASQNTPAASPPALQRGVAGQNRTVPQQPSRPVLNASSTNSSGNLPLIVYMLIGALISGPYLMYKSVSAWNENEEEQRESWLLNQQREWLCARRSEPYVQEALQKSHRVEMLERHLQQVKELLTTEEQKRDKTILMEMPEHIQKRRQAARAAAVGEAAQLHQSIEELINHLEPMPPAPSAPKKAALKKQSVFSLFGRQ